MFTLARQMHVHEHAKRLWLNWMVGVLAVLLQG